MGEFAPMHWLVIAIVALVIFGPKRLPEIGRSLGQALREFKKAFKEDSLDESVTKNDSLKPESMKIEQKKL